MKLFIIGHARHGKDEVARIIQDCTGLTWESSSHFVGERAVWPHMTQDYPDYEACFADRSNRRVEWFQHIQEYNGHDPSRLSRELFAVHDMYVGLRRREELLAARDMADLVIWVDGSRRHPPESVESFTCLESDADIVMPNHQTVSELEGRVSRLCNTWNLVRDYC